ncbi:MAG: mechanosensitive ion channel [Caldilineae bacterium]|nr:mechanosensitive ion channel [Chloroflexota bacterium]MCB9177090.1 mechanosensitive ion channel [Caldilineae bacterium]
MPDLSFLTDDARALEALLRILPMFAKALVILVAGFMLARLLARLARQTAERIGLSVLLDRTGLSEGLDRAQITRQPAEILASVVRRLVQFGAVMYSLDILGISLARDLLSAVFGFLPALISATVALVAGAMVAQFAGQVVQAGAASAGIDLHAQLGRLVRTLLMMITLIFAIRQLGAETAILESTFVNLLSLSIAGMALAFGLGARDVAADLLAGHYARLRFEPGDRITVDGVTGSLDGIGPLNAQISDAEGRVILPNRRLTGSAVRVHPG